MHRQTQWFEIFLMVCSVTVLLEGQLPFVHGSDIAFAIRTDQQKYAMADTIIIRYELRNVSNGALFVPKSQWGIRCGSVYGDKKGAHEPMNKSVIKCPYRISVLDLRHFLLPMSILKVTSVDTSASGRMTPSPLLQISA